MNEKELESLRKIYYRSPKIGYQGSDKTLIWGYTIQRDSFHVYSEKNTICRYIYDYDGKQIQFEQKQEWDVQDLIPDKRTYPSASDFEFCKKIIQMGYNISFTTIDERELRQFYGKTK